MIRAGAGGKQCFSDSSNGNISTFLFNVFPSTVRMCSAQRPARLRIWCSTGWSGPQALADLPPQPKREPFKAGTADVATDYVSPPDPLVPSTCTQAAQPPTETYLLSYKARSQGSQRKVAHASEPQLISSKHHRWCLNNGLPHFGR